MSITSDPNPMASLAPVDFVQPVAESIAVAGLSLAGDAAALPAVEASVPVSATSADAGAVLAVEGKLPAMTGGQLGAPILAGSPSAGASIPGTLVSDVALPTGALPPSMVQSPNGNAALPVVEPS